MLLAPASPVAERAPAHQGDVAPASGLEGSAKVEIDLHSGSVLVSLTGELDLASAAVIGPMLDVLVKQPQQLVIDVSAVTFVDCAGLSPLLRAERAAGSGRGGVRLRGQGLALSRLTGLMDHAGLPRPRLLATTHPLAAGASCAGSD